MFRLQLEYFLVPVKDLITICHDPYLAADKAHAIVICTEWDDFLVSTQIYGRLFSKYMAELHRDVQ